MTLIRVSKDINIDVNYNERIAILSVGGWETMVYYDEVHRITADSEAVRMLRRVSEV